MKRNSFKMDAEIDCDGEDRGLMTSNLQELLPKGYDYHVCTFEEHPGPSFAFTGVIRVNIDDETVAKEWVKEFGESSFCTWRVHKTCNVKHRYVVFKKSYRCQHNTRAKAGVNEKRKNPSKDTKCPTTFTLTVKSTVSASNKLTSRNMTDSHLPHFPTVIKFRYEHNHNINCPATLRHRDVSKATEEKLTALFYLHRSPSAALRALKSALQMEYGDEYYRVASDRSVCPDLPYCYRLHRKIFKSKVVASNKGEQDLLANLNEVTDQYNAKCGNMAVEFVDGQPIVAISTPIMQRVHTLHPSSGDLCFLDSSSNSDEQTGKIYMLLTHSCVGGLPLGVVITPSETQTAIAAALRLLQTVLPDGCFGGRGIAGPQMFITEDTTVVRDSLKEVFPQSQLLLCSFHLLQETWKWLWSSANRIPLTDRLYYLALMRRMIFASTPEEAELIFHSTMCDVMVKQSYKDHLSNAYSRSHEWACSYKINLPPGGSATNSYCVAALRVMKDRILAKTKAVKKFSIAQLADFLSTHLQNYYGRRILDVVNGQSDHILSSSSTVTSGDITSQDVTRLSETEYKVVSHKQAGMEEFHVDTQVGCCTCQAGRSGGPCKHQAAVAKHCDDTSLNSSAPVCVGTKITLYRIATGRDAPESGWFAGLQSDSAHEAAIQEAIAAVAELSDGIDEDDELGEQSSSPSSPAATHSQIDDVKERFKTEFVDVVMEKLNTCPETFAPAVEAMLEQCKNLHSDGHLASALFKFGTRHGANAPRSSSARKTAVKRLNATGTKEGEDQPSSAPGESPHSRKRAKESSGSKELDANREDQPTVTPEKVPHL